MMVERVREGKRVNGGEGVSLCSGSSDRSLPGLLISDKIISVDSGLKRRCMYRRAGHHSHAFPLSLTPPPFNGDAVLSALQHQISPFSHEMIND